MPNMIVLGTQWGDEGKGKIVDVLTEHVDIVVRAQGGNNAGHTILIEEKEYKLHLVPSGILHPHTVCYIAGGVVVDPSVLVEEIKMLEALGIDVRGRLFISERAHIIFPYHKIIDGLQESRRGQQKIGTTNRGIGPSYADKITRTGIRMVDFVNVDRFSVLLKDTLNSKNEELEKIYGEHPLSFDRVYEEYSEYGEYLKPFVLNVESNIHCAIEQNKSIVLEGAQGNFLDINMGTYPFVTSSCTLAAGLCSGAGVGPTNVDYVVGVVKAYSTRVGAGPFPTKLLDGDIFLDHLASREFGSTTGRARNIGWFDAVLVREAAQTNGIHSLAVTKLDVLDDLDTIKICVAYELRGERIENIPCSVFDVDEVVPVYEEWKGWKTSTKKAKTIEDLPNNARIYLNRIEELINVPIGIISCGPERRQTIFVNR